MSHASVSSALPITTSTASLAATRCGIRHQGRHGKWIFTTFCPSASPLPDANRFALRVTNGAGRAGESPPERSTERSEADKIVDGMDFGELCNEFECVSSPLVESTARQLARDILQLRQGNRALETFAVSVRYTDPVRSFTGRDKYQRRLWVTDALDDPSVTVQEMVMLSTSVLNIKWTIKGRPKSFIGVIGGDLIIKVNSQFTLNQISGQVIEHEEVWDLSASSIVGQLFFWTSRRLSATVEAGRDLGDLIKNSTRRASTESENLDLRPDLSGDPTKVSSDGTVS
uniref:Uncharacterized protein n=1 Tax=Rhizophora mucronata TaxID=61149 RepID=A0A2P2K0B6_RHIMU